MVLVASDHAMPFLGENMVASEAAQVTRTEPGGEVDAVFWRRGVSSSVKSQGPRTLVPI